MRLVCTGSLALNSLFLVIDMSLILLVQVGTFYMGHLFPDFYGDREERDHCILFIGTVLKSIFFFFLFFLVFLGLYMRHMEVPRLGVESELQLLAYISKI